MCASLYYRSHDDGGAHFQHPVIFIHGMGGSHLAWPPRLRHLPGKKTYAIDLPAHGKSPGAACSSLSILTERLERFLNEMGFYRVILVGHSMGSAIAFQFAQTNPGRVQGMVMISCGTQFHTPDEFHRIAEKNHNQAQMQAYFHHTAFHQSFPRKIRREVLRPMAGMRSSTLRADMAAGTSFKARPNTRLEGPTLIICGDSDLFVPLHAVFSIQYMLPRTQLHILGNTGHMAVFERTEAIRTDLTRFFNQFDRQELSGYRYSLS